MANKVKTAKSVLQTIAFLPTKKSKATVLSSSCSKFHQTTKKIENEQRKVPSLKHIEEFLCDLHRILREDFTRITQRQCRWKKNNPTTNQPKSYKAG